MAYYTPNNNSGIPTLDLTEFGLTQPQENMQVAEAFNYNTLPQATQSFNPRSTMTTGSVVDRFMNENPNATKGDFVNALQSGSLGVGGNQLFDKNVDDLFEGVNLDERGFGFGNVSPTFKGTTDGSFRGNIDIDKGALSDDALQSLPKGFFQNVGDQSSLIGPAGYPLTAMAMNPNRMTDAYSGFFNQGDAISRTNVQGMDLEMDPGARINPNIQPSQNMFQRAGNFINDLDLEEYLPFIGERSLTGIMGRGLGKVGRGIGSLFNAPYRGATRGGGGYTIDQLNRQNARGGYYTDTARSQRRDAASIQNMINRAASGKNYGANRLDKLGKEAGMSSEDISRAITDRKTAAPSHIGNDNTTGTGGGKIVCTMMNDSYGFGNFRNKIWLKHSRDLPKEYEVGYHKIFLPLVKFAKGEGKINKVVKKTLEHVARHRTLDLKQEMKGKTHILGRVYRKILEPICFLVGKASMFTRRG